jgi:transcriptional regulator with XRE-family HTH domain
MLQEKVINKIRKKRDELSYSQAYMAEQLSMTPQNYQQIEAGATKLTLDRIEQIATIFNLNANELISESNHFQNDMSGKVEGSNNIGSINYVENILQAEKSNDDTIQFYRTRIENLEAQLMQLTALMNKIK